MVAKPFVWGRGGAMLTPEELAKERELEAKIASQGIDFSPVADPLQGLSRVANAALGAYRRSQLDEKQAANDQFNNSLDLSSGLIGSRAAAPTAAPSPAPSASIPTPDAAKVVSARPGSTAAPVFADDGTELGSYLSDPARRATLPAGMRNNNPGNIKYVGQKVPGIVGPSVNTDQGDPQAVFDTPESGMRAMHALLSKKYAGGKLTPNDMIAGNMGWTPGNYQAAANVARTMGIKPDEDIGFNDPQRAASFMQALILQEHGQKGKLYPQSMIASAIGGTPQPQQAPVQVASADPASSIGYAAPQPVSPAAAAIDAQAKPSGYVDPRVSVQPDPQQVASFPPMDAPRTIAPAPAVAAPPEVAQAAPAPAQAGNGPLVAKALRALQDPRTNAANQRIAQIIIQQEMQRQQAIQQQALKQSDPSYQVELDLKRQQLEDLRNPKMKPGEQANLDLNREKFDFEKGQADKTGDIKEYNLAKSQGYPGTFADYQMAMKKAGSSSTNVNVGGGSDKQIFDEMKSSYDAASVAAKGLTSLREARTAVDNGAILGAGADNRLALQKIGAQLGVTNPDAIVNTETFRSAIAPQVAALMKQTVGSTNISNSDREFAEKAAGGSITLEKGTITRLLDIMERANTEVVKNHMDRLDRVYPDGQNFGRERALFGVAMPQAPAPNPNADALSRARDAISRGADPAKVRERLLQGGIDPSGL